MIAFVGIDAVLLRGSLAHGCNTKGQGKAWAISTELRQCRSIHVQGFGCIVWALRCRSQASMWHTTTWSNKKHFTIQGVPMTLHSQGVCPVDGGSLQGPRVYRFYKSSSCAILPWLSISQNISLLLFERVLRKMPLFLNQERYWKAREIRASLYLSSSKNPDL